jgi:ABC-type nitrate/sulfonate/bicarbonate transport system substrate-binding protein
MLGFLLWAASRFVGNGAKILRPLSKGLTSAPFCNRLQELFTGGRKMARAALSEPGRAQTVGLSVIAFPGASNWPLWAGQRQGFFADQGLDISLSVTPNSVHMARELHGGGVHVALTSMDNVVAYGCGEGEVSLGEPADFFAFMSVDDGLLSLMVQPEHDAVSCLRGHTLAVDALTTGYALVLKEILARHGLAESDLRYVSVGTGAERFVALKEGRCAATLLNAPLCLAAEAAGKKRLVRASAVLGPYQGVVAAARRRWASDNSALIHGFMRGYDASLSWLCDPANAVEACALLVERLPWLRPVADGAYRVLITERGLDRSLRLHPQAVDAVISLRERHGSRGRSLGAAGAYIEDDYWRAVFG